MKNLLIIIPAYNVENKLKTVLSKLEEYKSNCLVINDGSTDNTFKIIEQAGFNKINLSYNSGVSNAILTGLKYAINNNYQYVILMDADGQHNPNDIDKFITALNDHDAVFANRFGSKNFIPSCKIVSNAFASIIYQAISGCFIPDVACGYKAFKVSQELVDFLEASEGYSIIYRLTNYIIMNNLSIMYICTDAIYYSDNLLYTRTSELISLIKSAMELEKNYELSNIPQKTKETINKLLKSVYSHEDFNTNICNIHFFAFYLETYDGYFIQASLANIHDYYERQKKF